jgi:hypothetical protein
VTKTEKLAKILMEATIASWCSLNQDDATHSHPLLPCLAEISKSGYMLVAARPEEVIEWSLREEMATHRTKKESPRVRNNDQTGLFDSLQREDASSSNRSLGSQEGSSL